MRRAILFIVLVALLVFVSFVSVPHDKVVFLDVGQGDSILFQQGTHQVLIDGGQGMTVLERLGEELSWFDRRLEVLIATHPDRDHLEGLLHVIERYDVGLVLLPKMPHSSQLQDAWLTQLQAAVRDKNIQYRFAWEGQRLKVGEELNVAILGPFMEEGEIVAPGGKTNNAAVLTRVDFRDFSFLLTSDAEAVIERMLVAREGGQLDVDVLKAGHHGSKTSTTSELLSAASPSAVIISVGADNRYGHPHEDVLKRIADIPLWRTDQDGSVRFLFNKGKWLLATQHTL